MKFIKFETTDNVKITINIDNIIDVEENKDKGICIVSVARHTRGGLGLLSTYPVLNKFDDIYKKLNNISDTLDDEEFCKRCQEGEDD